MGAKLTVSGSMTTNEAMRQLQKSVGMPVLPSYIKLRTTDPKSAIKPKGRPDAK